MNNDRIFESLQRGFGDQFICTDFDDFQRVQTPYLYPDGEHIDLYCKSKNGVITITDFAETTGWLSMHSVSGSRSNSQILMIEDACVTHGVEFQRGMIQARCSSVDELAPVFTRVAQAALRISDLWFTFRTSDADSKESVADEVADCLDGWRLAYKRKIKHSGRSERAWTIDFEVTADHASKLVQILSSPTRSGKSRVTEHVAAAWFDLKHSESFKHLHNNAGFISLFHDENNVWKDQDYRLLEPLSTISKWSNREEFRLKLDEAA